MRIVDAHHHLWDPVSNGSRIGYSWLRDIGAPKPFGDPTPIQRDYLAPEYLSETEHEIVGSVHVQADGGLPDPVAETVWLERIAEEHGIPSAIVGFVDLTDDDTPRTIERHLSASRRFRGVRQIVARTEGRPDISFAPDELLANATWRRNFARLASYDLSFDLQLHPAQADAALDLLTAHPDVPIVIDHAGSPHDQSTDGLHAWERGLRRLADLSHVCVKVSGLGMFDRTWSPDSVERIVRPLIDAFGAERTMFGSNFPVDRLFHRFDAMVDAVRAAVGNDHTTQVFERTAHRIYRIGS